MVGRIISWGVIVGVIVLVGLALIRPATLFGVDAQGLGNSLGGEVHHAEGACVEQKSGHWRCVLQGSDVNGVEYTLSADRYGCWSATTVAQPRSANPVDGSVTGCIGITDMFGG